MREKRRRGQRRAWRRKQQRRRLKQKQLQKRRRGMHSITKWRAAPRGEHSHELINVKARRHRAGRVQYL